MMYVAAQVKPQAMARPITLGSQQQGGFGYLAVLLIVLVLAVAMGATYERIDTVMQREKEQEWLFAGKQYRQAITSYYNKSPSGFKELPNSIDDLLQDKRFVATTRHLRKPFADPLTGGDWVLERDENQKIIGVYSQSTATVLQISQLLDVEVDNLIEAATYADIKFLFKAKEKAPASDVEGATSLEGASSLPDANPPDTSAADANAEE